MGNILKTLLTILFLIPFFAHSTIYYISSSDGSDSDNGTSEATAFLTLAKLNSVTLVAGDQVLLKRGDTWFETLTVNQSGSAGNVITYGAYGSGSKPVISGFTTVSAWTDLGGGIQESTSAVTSSLTMNLVTFQDTLQPMGRWPKADSANAGYRNFQSHSGNTSITSDTISTAASFVGGEVVIRKFNYVLDRGRISAQTSTTVTYAQPIAVQQYSQFANVTPPNPINGFGFFFQNHINACTRLGEWAYDTITSKLQMYFGGASPASYTIKVTAIDILVSISSKNYITFDNISITGANVQAVKITTGTNIIFNACDISYCGVTAIEATGNTTNISIIGCTITNCNNNALTCGTTPSWVVQNTTINKVGAIRGMGLSGAACYEAISYIGDKSLLEYNIIKNIGYNGIAFRGDSVIVRYNLIDSFNTILTDGGAIYTYAETTKFGRRIYNNIVLNGIGDFKGSPAGYGPITFGIYTDGGARNIEITNNTLAHCAFGGMELNYPQNVTVTGNTLYNNGLNGVQSNSSAGFLIDRSGGAITGLTIKNNIAFAKLPEQLIIYTNTPSNNFSTWGAIDSNYYCRPIDEPSGINGIVGFGNPPPWNDGGIIVANIGGTTRFYSLDGWQTLSGVDANTVKTPMTITSVDSLRFEYNATNSPVVVDLPYNYMDARGVEYDGEITLQPYTSAVLIQNGAATTVSTIQVPGRKAIVQ